MMLILDVPTLKHRIISKKSHLLTTSGNVLHINAGGNQLLGIALDHKLIYTYIL